MGADAVAAQADAPPDLSDDSRGDLRRTAVVFEGYQRRRVEYEAKAEDARKRVYWLSNARGGSFLLALILAGSAWGNPAYRVPLLLAAALTLVVFTAYVHLHGKASAALRKWTVLAKVNAEGAARVRREWSKLPAPEVSVPPRSRVLATDLNLFGQASVFQLCRTTSTPAGIRTLRDWLLEPAEPREVRRRQPAVVQLAAQRERRQSLEALSRQFAQGQVVPEAFFDWAAGERWLAERPWLKLAAWLVPATAIVLYALDETGLWRQSLWAWTLIAGFLIGALHRGQTNAIFNSISTEQHELRHARDMFAVAEEFTGDAPMLLELRDSLRTGGGGAHVQLSKLQRIVDFANLRYSTIPHFVLQTVFLWDFHVLAWLERWQRGSGHAVRGWFDRLAQLEALCGLAAVAHDNPDWTLPDLVEAGDPQLVGTRLGHPLIAARERVCNDVTVGPPGRVLLVTGSNMSGKSTLLRAIGSNVVLAQAGTVVCADALTLPPVTPATSMRVQDSLADGVSFFMAELQRLKQIVDDARRHTLAGRRTLLYLLDEILQGTNSVERQIAVRRVLTHLLGQNAIGAISTHDLDLADASPLDVACEPVHFRESFAGAGGRTEMTFDYRMRAGVATTTNALKLLEMVGLAE